MVPRRATRASPAGSRCDRAAVVVVVAGASADHRPGIEAAATVAEIRFAAGRRGAPAGARRGRGPLLRAPARSPDWRRRGRSRRRCGGSRSASDGVDRLLFPAIAEQRRRGDERARRLRRRDRRVGDRGDPRDDDRSRRLDRRARPAPMDRRPPDRPPRREALLAVGPGPARPGRGAARARPRHGGGGGRAHAAGRRPVRARSAGRTTSTRCSREADVVLDVLPLTPRRGTASTRPRSRRCDRARASSTSVAGRRSTRRRSIDALRRGGIGGRRPRRLRGGAAPGLLAAVDDAERDRLAAHVRGLRGLGARGRRRVRRQPRSVRPGRAAPQPGRHARLVSALDRLATDDRARRSRCASCTRATATSRRFEGSSIHVDAARSSRCSARTGRARRPPTEILEGYRTRSAGEVSVLGHDPAKRRARAEGAHRHRPPVDGGRPVPHRPETIEMYAGYYPHRAGRPTR